MGAQVQLTLTVEEKTAVSPFASWMPNAIFSLGGSITGSADATRIDKFNYFYSVAELRSRPGCLPGAPAGSHPASLLVQSDLKLYNWLSSLVVTVVTDEISALLKNRTHLVMRSSLRLFRQELSHPHGPFRGCSRLINREHCILPREIELMIYL
jgi:hypothetical protein